MELRVFVEPQQGMTYDQQLVLARLAEQLGFGGFFRSDHYLKMGEVTGLPGPTDTLVTLAGLARETQTIRLGSLVCSATFRLPGPLAVAAAQIDQMSGGRLEMGIGAGWFDDEHVAYGIPFPSAQERFDRLEEQLAVITGLWRAPIESQFTFEGDHYGLLGSPALPKPAQDGGPPLIIGGQGRHRTPRLAAAYAAEYNLAFSPVSTFTAQRQRVRAACEQAERDPDSLVYSVALVVCCGRTAEEVAMRAGTIGRATDELRQNGAAGSPAEVLDTIATYAEAGAQRVYLQFLDVDDHDHLHLLADEVLRLLP